LSNVLNWLTSNLIPLQKFVCGFAARKLPPFLEEVLTSREKKLFAVRRRV